MEKETKAVAISEGGAPAPLVKINSLEDLIKLSEFLAKSRLVPKAYQGQPHDIAVCIMHGNEVGLSHMASLQSIAVINGNPGMYGDAPLALVRSSGLLEWIKEDWDENTQTATCNIKRVGDPTVYTGNFSKKDADRIGLSGKDNYKNFPRRMYQFRARSFPLRDAFGDVLKGMRQAEELEDIETTATTISSEPVTMPSRTSSNGAEAKPPEPDPLDQRHDKSEQPEAESQEPPKEEQSAKPSANLKDELRQWIKEAPEEEIMLPGATDGLFQRMKGWAEPDTAEIANLFIKRKQQTWAKWRDEQAAKEKSNRA